MVSRLTLILGLCCADSTKRLAQAKGDEIGPMEFMSLDPHEARPQFGATLSALLKGTFMFIQLEIGRCAGWKLAGATGTCGKGSA